MCYFCFFLVLALVFVLVFVLFFAFLLPFPFSFVLVLFLVLFDFRHFIRLSIFIVVFLLNCAGTAVIYTCLFVGRVRLVKGTRSELIKKGWQEAGLDSLGWRALWFG